MWHPARLGPWRRSCHHQRPDQKRPVREAAPGSRHRRHAASRKASGVPSLLFFFDSDTSSDSYAQSKKTTGLALLMGVRFKFKQNKRSTYAVMSAGLCAIQDGLCAWILCWRPSRHPRHSSYRANYSSPLEPWIAHHLPRHHSRPQPLLLHNRLNFLIPPAPRLFVWLPTFFSPPPRAPSPCPQGPTLASAPLMHSWRAAQARAECLLVPAGGSCPRAACSRGCFQETPPPAPLRMRAQARRSRAP